MCLVAPDPTFVGSVNNMRVSQWLGTIGTHDHAPNLKTELVAALETAVTHDKLHAFNETVDS